MPHSERGFAPILILIVLVTLIAPIAYVLITGRADVANAEEYIATIGHTQNF